jgi:hypothetical protein
LVQHVLAQAAQAEPRKTAKRAKAAAPSPTARRSKAV